MVFEGVSQYMLLPIRAPQKKVLLGKSIQAKEENWKFAWLADDRVVMRKSENSNVVHVTCEKDLVPVV